MTTHNFFRRLPYRRLNFGMRLLKISLIMWNFLCCIRMLCLNLVLDPFWSFPHHLMFHLHRTCFSWPGWPNFYLPSWLCSSILRSLCCPVSKMLGKMYNVSLVYNNNGCDSTHTGDLIPFEIRWYKDSSVLFIRLPHRRNESFRGWCCYWFRPECSM